MSASDWNIIIFNYAAADLNCCFFGIVQIFLFLTHAILSLMQKVKIDNKKINPECMLIGFPTLIFSLGFVLLVI